MVDDQEIEKKAQAQLEKQVGKNKRGSILRSEPVQSGAYFCVAEVNSTIGSGSPPEFWAVVVRDNYVRAYPQMDAAISDVIGKRWFFDFFSQNVVVTVLSLIIVITAVIAFFLGYPHVEALSSAFTLVLGFWFGKRGG